MPGTVQTTSNLSNAIRTKYASKYIEAAQFARLYDRLSTPIGREGVENAAFLGSSVQVNFLSDMPPGTTALSQLQDVTPTVLADATASISPTSRWGMLSWAEAIELQAYTNYGETRFKVLGKNQAESVDLLAQAQALQGGVLHRAVARASLDAGTTGHRLTDTVVSIIDAKLQTLKCPAYIEGNRAMWLAIMHPYVFHDLRLGGNIVSIAQYQKPEIALNFELGQVGGFKLLSSAWAKTFWGAGIDNATNIADTLASAADALDLTITVTSGASIAVGMGLSIGTEETANTHYETNERVLVTSVSGTTIGVAGEGANGGLRFDHESGVAVRNADSVFPVVFGGPYSLAKLYDQSIGEYGEIVGPRKMGNLDQFGGVGWKYYGNYGRWVEPWILRGEFASSLEA